MNVTKFIDHTDSVRVGRVDGNHLIPLKLGSSFQSLADLLAADDPIGAVGSLTEESPLLIDDSIRWLPPIDRQEVWAAGVTYKRSQTARMEESEAAASCYDRVYKADRPELFFKANPHRVSGHRQPLRIRHDATWNVPEPEVTLVLSPKLRIVGLTVGNDMSSRDIEGENPLYLPQAKCYDQCAGLGPWITLYSSLPPMSEIEIDLKILRAGEVVFDQQTSAGQMARSFHDLVKWLGRDNSFPSGAFLMTGTGIVPTSDFTLHRGDIVNISISGVGTLSNSIVQGWIAVRYARLEVAKFFVRASTATTPDNLRKPIMSTATSTATSTVRPVLVAGSWRDASYQKTFRATDPSCNQEIDIEFPVSSWEDCDAALDAAVEAARELRKLPHSQIAEFLERYADRIEAAKDALVESAFRETGLGKSPRLADVELPRTSNQLRSAAAACRSGSWALPTIDTAAGIRSCYEQLGPVCVFGPNNFPFAFGSVSGGDFAAAIAAGNPVIGKANSSHPETTRLFAEQAAEAIKETGLPPATVQLIYRTSHSDGERLVSDPRVGATGYTGSRSAGLALKAAADKAGKPIYLELSSVNPVVITPGALAERSEKIVGEFLTSSLMGTGQFCTNPGLVLLIKSEQSDAFINAVKEKYASTAAGTLLSPAVAKSLSASVQKLCDFGAQLLAGGGEPERGRCAYANTLLKASGSKFLSNPEGFQTEAFGNASLVVVADDVGQLCEVIRHLEGNLTGCLYSDTTGSDDEACQWIAAELTPKVGRLLNDKMPTGVAVSAAMNHGGPYPATGHPGFTAVGIPASLLRFGKLTSYDNVRPGRMPALLQNENGRGAWRLVDGKWTQRDLD